MLRLLIGTGLLLMAVGFGAAGWQYWRGPSLGDAAAAGQSARGGAAGLRLTSASGTLVPNADSLAYLAQDRFVPGRSVVVNITAPLAALLAGGEKLPDEPYLEVLADIRAPRLAQTLCPVLTDRAAQVCALHSARVVPGSVNKAAGTATFRLELAFRLKPEAEPLPDLATRVLEERRLDLGGSDADPATVEAALGAVLDASAAACAERAVAEHCRLLDLSLDWAPGRSPLASARIAWLRPLPEGMFPAPPLGSPPGN